jgi:hypothetical protein
MGEKQNQPFQFSRPPVFTSRCCKLVSDQASMRESEVQIGNSG